MEENSREEDIKMIEILKNKNLYINIKPKSSICIDCINKNKNKHIEAEVVINKKLEEAINYTLSDYKRVLKENEIYKKNSEIMSKENLSTAEQLKVEIKENFRLKNQLENNRKEYQETYKDVREELKELKKENEELNYKLHSKKIALEIYNRYIPKSKLKDIIDRIDYDIKKTKEIISKNTNIYASYRKNDYQIVRLRAMNTKSLDIKKRLQELLESEE